MSPYRYESPAPNPFTGSIAEMLMRQHEAQGRAAEIGAQAWGTATQNIGTSVANALTGYAREKQEAPIRAAQLTNLTQGNELQGLQIAGAQRTAADAATLDQAGAPGLARAEFLAQVPGHLRPEIEKKYAEVDKLAAEARAAKQKAEEADLDYFGGLAAQVKPYLTGPDGGMSAAQLALAHAKEQGHDVSHIQQQLQSGALALPTLIDSLMQASPTQRKLAGEEQDRALKLTTEQRMAAQADAQGRDKDADNKRADAAATEAARHNRAMEARPVAGAPAATNNVADAVAGMKAGTLPPQLPSRASKDYTAILAEAKRQGYDLAAAVTDWQATQKHIATMNGAQQLRLSQSINALPEMLDTVETLAGKWRGGRFPILNRVNLAAAKNGAYGPDVASVATQLDAQIADVTADLGNVYMGGNSPTDHALQLAEKALKSDWSEKVLRDMVGLARNNVQVRLNSIRNTGVAGASANNPYAPPAPSGADDAYAAYLKRHGGNGAR